MTLALPVEVIEHAVGFLRDDVYALSNCALTCSSLLTTCRVLIWSDITLPVMGGDQFSRHPRVDRFLDLLHTNPDLAQHIRSLTLEWTRNELDKPFWDTVVVWLQLPRLRQLTFRGIAFDSFASLLQACRALPLETLVIEQATCVTTQLAPLLKYPGGSPGLADTPAHVKPPPSLKRLRIVRGVFSSSALTQLANVLLAWGMHESLEELDLDTHYLSWNVQVPADSDDEMTRSWARLLAEIGPRLQRYGLKVPHARSSEDMTRVRRTLCRVLPCTYLRTLSLRASLLAYASLHSQAGIRPFVFIEALAAVLACAGPSPFPHLEELKLSWTRSFRTLPGCADACALLVLALVEDPTRYSSLQRLEVHSQVVRLGSNDSWLQKMALAEWETLVTALGGVEAAGVRLDVAVTLP
ncbi:hypothetical protein C8Q76DRAFT_699404 [Earliella scabrosa]|nr:hypothetical protein C8Q76DRAFT_699404 [Earliella scabrosa]